MHIIIIFPAIIKQALAYSKQQTRTYLDDAPIASRAHAHPFHSQTSRLLLALALSAIITKPREKKILIYKKKDQHQCEGDDDHRDQHLHPRREKKSKSFTTVGRILTNSFLHEISKNLFLHCSELHY